MFFFSWCYSVIISIVFSMNLKVHTKNAARTAARAAELRRFIKFWHGPINICRRCKLDCSIVNGYAQNLR